MGGISPVENWDLQDGQPFRMVEITSASRPTPMSSATSLVNPRPISGQTELWGSQHGWARTSANTMAALAIPDAVGLSWIVLWGKIWLPMIEYQNYVVYESIMWIPKSSFSLLKLPWGGGNTLFSDTPIWNKQLIEQRRTKLNRSQGSGKKNRTVEIHESSVMCNQFSLVIMVVSHSMLIPFFPFYGKIPCYHSMLIFFGGCVGKKKSSQHASINHHMFIDLKHGFLCKLGASNFDASWLHHLPHHALAHIYIYIIYIYYIYIIYIYIIYI